MSVRRVLSPSERGQERNDDGEHDQTGVVIAEHHVVHAHTFPHPADDIGPTQGKSGKKKGAAVPPTRLMGAVSKR